MTQDHIKRVFIDVETTGLNPDKNGIIQLSGIIEVSGSLKDQFDFLICPLPTDIVEAKALSISGRTEEEVRKFETPQEVHKKFLALLDKHIDKYNPMDKAWFLGYNGRFDYGFMYAWFRKLNDKYLNSYFWTPPLDIMALAAEHCKYIRRRMKNFKLFTVARALNIQMDGKAHDALTDIRVSRAIYNHVKASDVPFSNFPNPLTEEDILKDKKRKEFWKSKADLAFDLNNENNEQEFKDGSF